MSLMTLSDLKVRRGTATVVDAVSLDIAPGEVLGLLGPKGAGKTTLMRAAQGLVPHEGTSSLTALPARERARALGWLPQTRDIAWPVTVETLVALGRTPYLAGGRKLSVEDRRAVSAAIAYMDLEPLRHRTATELSGGEQARALIARVLAQETPLIMADEPVAGLDPGHQISLMRLFRKLADDGKAVIVSLHDLTLAARHCTRLALLDKGKLVMDGTPDVVLSDARCRAVFGVGAYWHDAPDGRALHILEET